MVVNIQEDLMPIYLQVSQQLRRAGINVVTNFEKKQLGKQFQLADKQGIRFCVIIGSQEAANAKSCLKDLSTGEQIEVPFSDLAPTLQQILQPTPSHGG
jgi:histidyl-tRNA synthetase